MSKLYFDIDECDTALAAHEAGQLLFEQIQIAMFEKFGPEAVDAATLEHFKAQCPQAVELVEDKCIRNIH